MPEELCKWESFDLHLNTLHKIHEGILVGGRPTPLKNMLVSWVDDIPNWMESHNPAMFQTTKQIIIYK